MLSGKQRQFNALAGPVGVWRTAEHGAVTVTIDQSGELRLETFASRQRR